MKDRSLSSRAMLITVNISQWTARKYDRKVTKETNESHGAMPDAGRYNKALIGKEAIKPVQKAANAIRTFHLEQTLPWIDKGPRILPAENFVQYQSGIRPLLDAFEKEADSFEEKYPEYYEQAKSRLNGMFDAFDYPAPAEIRSRFTANTSIMPLPDQSDFRVDLDSDTVDSIKAEIESQILDVEKTATQELWNRVYKAVSHMAQRLDSYEVDSDGKASNPFRDSLVGNVQELADLLPRLNITGDPEMDAKAKQIASDLCAHSPKELRESESLRKSVSQTAESIADSMAGYTS